MRKNIKPLLQYALIVSVAAVFLFFTAISPPERTAAQDELAQELDRLLADPALDGAFASVAVRSGETGALIYSHGGDKRLAPASNQKLFTAAAALDTLGADYRFTTTVSTDGKVKGKEVKGNLYLKGTGDPTMLQKDYKKLAKDLAKQGIKKVKGQLVADDTWFDDVRLGSDWSWDDEPYYYSAQISALTLSPNEDYDSGTIIVKATPGKRVGQAADIEITPKTDYVTIVNKAKTVPKGEKNTIEIEREHGNNNIVITGNIPLKKDENTREWMSVWEPTGYAAAIFYDALKDQGIKVKGGIAYGETPKGTAPLAVHRSMTLEELLVPFQKLSNNGHAEILVKAMGRHEHNKGSWSAGLKVVKAYSQKANLNEKTIVVQDGSGLSRRNFVPAEEVSNLLYYVQDEAWFPIFYDALPIAGMSDRFVGGTLRNRMKGTAAEGNVHAKTGSLTGVSSLSGYVDTAGGERLIFSIMMNNYTVSGSVMTGIQDKIAIKLAEYGG
ncbi:D-alanyl-D-alanine carboxypeptidase/D-alanyl-D-alanine endopeptidase [Numidum massiliense]|uniref:D-alanyl-D-alanine carboxypeptidase/D-alanyl-D-alanine endopeptidase n=1 Tax=Numidum massiliense TaxID=1522315 RepID=UPI0006D52B4B